MYIVDWRTKGLGNERTIWIERVGPSKLGEEAQSDDGRDAGPGM